MALIIHNYMLKKNLNSDRNYSYSIKKYFDENDKSVCIIAKDNNEAKYLFNELISFKKLILGKNEESKKNFQNLIDNPDVPVEIKLSCLLYTSPSPRD